MGKLWVVLRREYLERVRSRWFLVATIFGPLLFAGLLFLPSYLSSRAKRSADVSRVRIIDATGTELGKRVAMELNGGLTGDTTRTQVVVVTPKESRRAETEAAELARRGRIRGYLVLEPSTMAGGHFHYVGTNATVPTDMRHLEEVVTREVVAERLTRAGVPPAEADGLKKLRVTLRSERLTAAGRGGSGRVSALVALSVSMLLYVTIFIYGQNVLRSVIEEKQTRVAEVVVSSVSPATLLGGKVLGVGAVGLTQQLIWLCSSVVLYRLRVPILAQFGVEANAFPLPSITLGSAALLVLFFLLGYTFYAALFAAVGSMVNSEQDAQQAQLPVVLLLVASAIALQPALNAPESQLTRALSWLPFSSPLVMPLRMSTSPVSGWEIGMSVLTLLASCYIVVFVAARIYRVGMLLYGKRPSLRQIVHWVRVG